MDELRELVNWAVRRSNSQSKVYMNWRLLFLRGNSRSIKPALKAAKALRSYLKPDGPEYAPFFAALAAASLFEGNHVLRCFGFAEASIRIPCQFKPSKDEAAEALSGILRKFVWSSYKNSSLSFAARRWRSRPEFQVAETAEAGLHAATHFKGTEATIAVAELAFKGALAYTRRDYASAWLYADAAKCIDAYSQESRHKQYCAKTLGVGTECESSTRCTYKARASSDQS